MLGLGCDDLEVADQALRRMAREYPAVEQCGRACLLDDSGSWLGPWVVDRVELVPVYEEDALTMSVSTTTIRSTSNS